MLQHIYVIYNPYTKLTKIGISNNLEKRLQSLSNACGVKLYCAFKSEAVDNAAHIELSLHNRFANQRQMGEWFDCEPDTVIEAIRYYGLVDIRKPPIVDGGAGTATAPEDGRISFGRLHLGNSNG